MCEFFGVGKGLLLMIIVSLMFYSTVLAQYETKDLNLEEDVTPWFLEAIGREQTKLVSGSYHQIQRGSSITHQFFKENGWTSTSIIYYGKEFHLSGAMYDLEFDHILLRHPTQIRLSSQPIKLHQDKVSFFKIHGHTFRFYNSKDDPPRGEGFYDELYLGDTVSLIVKRSKEKKVKFSELTPIYESNDSYFLKYHGEYIKVNNKRSIFRILKPYKKDLKKFIRRNGLKIKVGSDHDLVMLLDYFESVIKAS